RRKARRARRAPERAGCRRTGVHHPRSSGRRGWCDPRRARMNDVVVTHGLSKRYAEQTALDAVELRVPDGAVYVLVGVNGAGKSTALKVLMNLETADSGTAEIFGLDTVARGPEARAQVGYVPERHDQGYS